MSLSNAISNLDATERPEPPTQPAWRARVWLIIRLVVSGGLLVALVWRADPAQILAKWQQASPWLLLLAFALQLSVVALSALKWRLLLQANGQHLPYRWLLGVSFVGLFANNFLPTAVGGDATRVVALGRRTGQYAQAGASVLMERLTGLVALSLIALTALLVTSTDLGGTRLINTPALALGAGTFALVALAIAGAALAAPWLLGHVAPLIPRMARPPLESIATALGQYAQARIALVGALGLSFLVHAAWIGTHVAAGLALGLNAPLALYALIVPLTDIIGIAPIFFNNVGARDLVFTLYLGQLGIADASALALAFTIFSLRLLASMIGGLVLLFGGIGRRD
ncbi:MAG: lysylphosphatidylglycerol synthase transmembrane domain-containing protein [Oscillochloridaceae bacterium umkhey_bin13]